MQDTLSDALSFIKVEVLDENDSKPILRKECKFSVKENTEIGAELVFPNCDAFDPDGKLK